MYRSTSSLRTRDLFHTLIVFEPRRANTDNRDRMREGVNAFLEALGISLRRDTRSSRPRVNELDSQLDREQKPRGEYYYDS
ncbi:hypothetical protein DJ71_17440 [Halorubrum sp. E3]|nr:hypothetical protein DJ71_17440 [Halorubrum sp. E3]OYR85001.1 hypothetical protein DJ72_04765 [Halorubrum distributum]PHQ44744.1 hypothetical protein DJ68_16810 [Halorubrum sp. C3]